MEAVFKLAKIEFEFDETILVRLYGRTQKNERICLFETFYDYILIDVSNSDVEQVKSKVSGLNKKLKFEDFEAEVSDMPVKLLKVFTPNLEISEKIIKFIKDELGLSCYENDISFEKKYLLEKNIEYSKNYMIKFIEKEHDLNVDIYGQLDSMLLLNDKSIDISFKILYFDIETYIGGDKIDYRKNPVLMISLYGKSYFKTLIAKVYDTKEKNVEMFHSELEMLERLEDVIKEYNPDIISGYNIKGFDISYLIERYKLYGIDFNIGTDFSNFTELKTKVKYSLEGVLIFDIYQLMRHLMRFSVSNGFSLDSVSKELLGDKKEKVDLKRLSVIWETDFDSAEMDLFIKYCMKDSVLCFDLYNYFKFDLMEFIKMLNVSLEDLTVMSSSQIIESYLTLNAREFNQVIPNLPAEEDIRSRRERHIQGAFVFDPIPGFYENIAVFDFTSLYPTIIESHNITKGTISLTEVPNSIKVPERNYYVMQNKKAFIPTVIGEIVTRRIRIKEMLKSNISFDEKKLLKSRLNTLKIIANSMYGYLVFYMSRWYSYEAGEAVTSFSRFNTKNVISVFECEGYKVIYSDTDSVFVLLGKHSIDETQAIVDGINSGLPGQMNLEFENLFVRGIFVGQMGSKKGAKKKYALLSDSGKYKIAGLALVRGDTSFVAREIQERVVHILLEKKDSSKALEYVKDSLDGLEMRDVSDFIISTKLTKAPDDYESKGPHVLVAEKRIANDEFVRVGSMIDYVICKGVSKRIGDRARIPSEVKISDIDFEYYRNNQIIPVLEGLFGVFDIDVDNEVNKKDSDLSSFF